MELEFETSDSCDSAFGSGVTCSVWETSDAFDELRDGRLGGTGGFGPREEAYERCEARDSIDRTDELETL